MWTSAFVVQRDSQTEVEDYLHCYAVEHQDRESLDGWMAMSAAQAKLLPPAVLKSYCTRFAAGGGGYETAERIADRLKLLADSGIDGVPLTWVDHLAGRTSFNASVLPQLEQAGLRERFSAHG